MPLSSKSKVCDLQGLVAEVFHLNPFKDEDWNRSGMVEREVMREDAGGRGYVQIGRWVDGKVKGFR